MIGLLFLYAIISSLVGLLIYMDRSSTDFASPQSLILLQGVGFISTVYTILWVWIRPFQYLNKLSMVSNPTNSRRHRNPRTGILMIFMGINQTPTLCGLVLFYLGISLMEFLIFVGVSLFNGLAWSFYNLRKSKKLVNESGGL